MNNATFDVEDWNNEYARRYIVSTILQSFFLIFGFSGNLIVLATYITKMKSTHDDRYFIPILAGVDLSGCVVSTTLILLSNNQPYKYPSSLICKSLNGVTCGLIVASIFLLLVISVQRYQKICRPFGFQMNLKCKRTVVTMVLIIATVFVLPSFFLYEKVQVIHPVKNITGHRCGPVPSTKTVGEIYRCMLMAAELISVISMSVLYGFVGYTLLTRRKPAGNVLGVAKPHHKTIDENPQESGIPSRKGNMRSGKQYSLMFMSISLISILCFFPPWICIILETKDKAFWDHLTHEETQVFILMRGVFVLNFVINPFIYGFFDSKFRENVKSIFKMLTEKK